MAAFTRLPVVVVDPSLTSVTVSWQVDTITYGQIGYGTDPNNLDQVQFDSTYDTTHSVLLSGLTASTSYTYIVTVIDAGGNTLIDSGKLTFQTVAAPAPAITTGPTALADPSAANIAWTANVDGMGLVNFGTAASALVQVVTDPTVSSDHAVSIQGLAAATQYFYKCCNTDPTTGSVLVASDVLNFTTAAAPPATGGCLVRACATPIRVPKNGTTQLNVWLRKGQVPIAGAPVTFQLITNNGTIMTPTVKTDATGRAVTTFKAGGKSGFVAAKSTSPNAVNTAFMLFIIRRS